MRGVAAKGPSTKALLLPQSKVWEILDPVSKKRSQAQTPATLMNGVSEVFESLGRALICLSPEFQVVHASEGLDRLLGDGAAEGVVGLSAEGLLGKDLFGEGGSMRRALESGQRREGWGATLRLADGRPRLVSITGAPLRHRPGSPCDPRVAYLIVARPPTPKPLAKCSCKPR